MEFVSKIFGASCVCNCISQFDVNVYYLRNKIKNANMTVVY